MVMSPLLLPNILEVILSSNINICCLLYFNVNIMYSFSFWGDPLPGLRPWIPLGDFHSPHPQSSFMSPQ